MLLNPPIGYRAQVWYRKGMREWMPYHGQIGEIVIVGKGRPRNHGIRIDGQVVVVPCGNLRKPQACSLGHKDDDDEKQADRSE